MPAHTKNRLRIDADTYEEFCATTDDVTCSFFESAPDWYVAQTRCYVVSNGPDTAYILTFDNGTASNGN